MEMKRIDPVCQPAAVSGIVAVYRQSFGGEPWNEGYVCPVCRHQRALISSLALCPVCAEAGRDEPLVEYWPADRVTTDFHNEMQNSAAACVVAEEDEVIIGFAWGYQVTSSPELSEKLEAPDLHEKIAGDYFYLDECAITPDHQGRGIGNKLVRYIIGEQSHDRILLRTKAGHRMHSIITHLDGEVVMDISEDRVIMGLRLG